MKRPSIAPYALIGSLVALATAAAAQETTVIEQHKEVRAPAAPPAPPPTSVTVKKTSTAHSASSKGLVIEYATEKKPARRPVRHVKVAKAAPAKTVVVEKSTAAPRAPAATVDRKTVIHRDENGDVSRHTRVERQDADGTTTVIHHSSETPAEAPPQ